ncbi:MAG: uracil-DNA glycosylase [Desulfovibrionaceae bacterium]
MYTECSAGAGDAADPLRGTAWQREVPFFAQGGHLPLLARVAGRRRHEVVYPPQDCLLKALLLTDFPDVRVLILGQDPYHGPGQAHGLAFSVPEGVPVPRSLRNIRREVLDDVYGGKIPPHWKAAPGGLLALCTPAHAGSTGDDAAGTFRWPEESGNLEHWARQGVLLLNVAGSVRAGMPGSHGGLGWQELTHAVLDALASRPEPVAVLLWGGWAAAYAPLFAEGAHLVLTAAHPSPLAASRGFFGCRHFSQVNAWLKARGRPEIVW